MKKLILVISITIITINVYSQNKQIIRTKFVMSGNNGKCYEDPYIITYYDKTGGSLYYREEVNGEYITTTLAKVYERGYNEQGLFYEKTTPRVDTGGVIDMNSIPLYITRITYDKKYGTVLYITEWDFNNQNANPTHYITTQGEKIFCSN